MAEKKKKGLLERATDYITDVGVKYMTGRSKMNERLQNPTAPPKKDVNLPKRAKKKKKKKDGQGGVQGVLNTVEERKKRMQEALDS